MFVWRPLAHYEVNHLSRIVRVILVVFNSVRENPHTATSQSIILNRTNYKT